MTTRVAINGFGRIGRLVLRALTESQRKDIVVVAVNDLGKAEDQAHLLKYDSVHGRYTGEVFADEETLSAGGTRIRMLMEKDPTRLPWRALGVDIVLECTGAFTKRKRAASHLEAGAKRVLVSAPCDGADFTTVFGVNHANIKPDHLILSNGSCTTNCLAPVASVLHELAHIRHGFMTTVHSYTGDQKIVDSLHKDARRARAAAVSMIPTSTGAAKAIGLVIPELEGRLDGIAIRVPTPNVSLIDLKVVTDRPVTAQQINDSMIAASRGALNRILSVTDEELVSVDFNHNPSSAVFDLTQTRVIDGTFVRVLAWYDNEWGFSNRMIDVARLLGSQI